MIKGSIHQEDEIPNTYAPKNGASKYIKQNDTTEVRNSSTIIVEGCKPPCSVTDKTRRQKIHKDI